MKQQAAEILVRMLDPSAESSSGRVLSRSGREGAGL